MVVRPPTPELRAPVAENDEKRLGVIFLQRLLRGRALKNDMFRAREKRLELIKATPKSYRLTFIGGPLIKTLPANHEPLP